MNLVVCQCGDILCFGIYWWIETSKFTPSKPAVGPEGSGGALGTGRWRVPRLILVVMSLTGASLLLLNIAIIACFVRRRARTRLAAGETQGKKTSIVII